MEKHNIRRALLARRAQLEPDACQRLSMLAQQRLLASARFAAATCLLLYSPIRNEVQTGLLFAAARQQGKRLCYPRVRQRSLDFVAVADLAELQPGAFGVREPCGSQLVAPEQVDLVVVPGVAFDRAGYRLGYGKGFYDRELPRFAPDAVRIGLCYEFQLCDRLPHEAHDVPMQFLATEQQFIPCHTAVAGSP